MTMWSIDTLSRRGVQMKTNFINKTKWDAAMVIAREEMAKPAAMRGVREVELEAATTLIDFADIYAVTFITLAPDTLSALDVREVAVQHAREKRNEKVFRELGLIPPQHAAGRA